MRSNETGNKANSHVRERRMIGKGEGGSDRSESTAREERENDLKDKAMAAVLRHRQNMLAAKRDRGRQNGHEVG